MRAASRNRFNAHSNRILPERVKPHRRMRGGAWFKAHELDLLARKEFSPWLYLPDCSVRIRT
jgi:hypothetical protein